MLSANAISNGGAGRPRLPRLFLLALLGLAFLGLSFSLQAAAETRDDDLDWAYAMAHELMSPFCPGRTLAECPSPSAGELRMWILTQAAAGASKDEIEVMLYERFGDVIRSTPRPEGWGLTAFVVPVLFFVLGGPLVFWITRRLVRGGPRALAAGPAADVVAFDPELERELERELGER